MAIAINVDLSNYSTYDALVAALPDYLDAQVDSSQVQGWFGLVEAEINRRLALRPVRPQIQRQSVNLDNEYESLPSDFMKEIAIDFVDGSIRRSLRWVDWKGQADDVANPIPETWLFDTTPDYTGFPEVAAITDDTEFRLFPVPDKSYTGSLLYYAKLDALSDANQTNWLSIAHSDIYLYGLLFHANAFLPDEEKAQSWFQLFDSRLQQVLTSYPTRPIERKLRSDAYDLIGFRAGWEISS
jgi:hypothetical protein